KPLAVNSLTMFVAKWEHSSGLIQLALLQSGSSSLEYAVNADRIPASIASVISFGMSRASRTSLTRDVSRTSGGVDVDQIFLGPPRRQAGVVKKKKPSTGRRELGTLPNGIKTPLSAPRANRAGGLLRASSRVRDLSQFRNSRARFR